MKQGTGNREQGTGACGPAAGAFLLGFNRQGAGGGVDERPDRPRSPKERDLHPTDESLSAGTPDRGRRAQSLGGLRPVVSHV